jgi:hypothetical protein
MGWKIALSMVVAGLLAGCGSDPQPHYKIG